MKRPKIGILKMFFFDNGHKRWFGAGLTCLLETKKFNPIELRNKNKIRPKMPIIDLKTHLNITTEKKLLQLLKYNWGVGTFMAIAYGGRANTYVFWRGRIEEEGYMFFKQE